MKMIDPDHPPASAWITAAATGLVGFVSMGGLIWLAAAWADNPDKTNLYTLVSAIGGVIVFEFLRYSFTIRRRHRRAVEDELRLKDVREEQLIQLLNQLDVSQQALHAMESAIELRARQQTLDARREHLDYLVDGAEAELREIRSEEAKLQADTRAVVHSDEIAERLATVLEGLDRSSPNASRRVFELTVEAIPFGASGLAMAAFDLYADLRERRRMRRLMDDAERVDTVLEKVPKDRPRS